MKKLGKKAVSSNNSIEAFMTFFRLYLLINTRMNHSHIL